MPGLFIRRQAEALTAFCDVAVLYIHADPECPNNSESEYAREKEVDVVRVYYRPGNSQISRWIRFYRAHMLGLDLLRGSRPDLVHAHVLTREGFMAWRIARKFHVPFVISEHWSRYFPENNTYHGIVRKLVTRLVVHRASAVIPVSEKLRGAMKKCGLDNPDCYIVPNVVESELFRPSATQIKPENYRIVHVSCFEDRSKDIAGFLQAVKELSGRRTDFECHLVGAGPDFVALKELADRMGLLNKRVFFVGLKEDEALVSEITGSDFTVLSSRYETFGTVILESLFCGVPVVSTAVGIAPEVIVPGNGILVPPGDPRGLAEAMDRMLGICRDLDPAAIRETLGSRFTKASVSRSLTDIYIKVLTTPHV
jgi:glycosyltransferase involved in cell wall biosynthesis